MSEEITTFYILPYRDLAARLATIKDAQELSKARFEQVNQSSARVRNGYWYDLQQAGATAYNNSNNLTFSAGTNTYGFPYMASLNITVPQSKVFTFYGIADYSPSPSLQAVQFVERSVAFPIIYLSPYLYTNEDHEAVMNAPIGYPQSQNDGMTIFLYGTKASTDPIDFLFAVAEKAAKL